VGCGRSFSVHSNMRRHLRVHYCPPHHGGNGMGSMRLPLVPNRFSDEEDEEDEDTESNRFDMQCNNMNIIKRGCTTSPPSTKLPSFSSLHSKS
jgi:hypothetical protein